MVSEFVGYYPCKHADEPHTIWYWIEDPNDPVPIPYVVQRDNQRDAVELVEQWMYTGLSPACRWIKIFRTSNESYICWKWNNNPEGLPLPDPTPEIVALATRKQHWAIRLRKKLLVNGTSQWNSWVRSVTAWLEVHF